MLNPIPTGLYHYEPWPTFVRYPRNCGWHALGPAALLVPGSAAQVRARDGRDEWVEVKDLVAERWALKRSEGRVRYVLATFDRCVTEEDESLP